MFCCFVTAVSGAVFVLSAVRAVAVPVLLTRPVYAAWPVCARSRRLFIAARVLWTHLLDN